MGQKWHQLDHMHVICTSLQTDASTSSLHIFLRPHFDQPCQSTEGYCYYDYHNMADLCSMGFNELPFFIETAVNDGGKRCIIAFKSLLSTAQSQRVTDNNHKVSRTTANYFQTHLCHTTICRLQMQHSLAVAGHLPTALVREVMKLPPSVCLSINLLPLYLQNRLTIDLKLLHVSKSWPKLAGE